MSPSIVTIKIRRASSIVESSFRFYEDHAVPGFAGAERGSRRSQGILNHCCERMHATKYASRGTFDLLERFHGLAEIAERCVGVHV